MKSGYYWSKDKRVENPIWEIIYIYFNDLDPINTFVWGMFLDKETDHRIEDFIIGRYIEACND